jgi:hypothetical protein
VLCVLVHKGDALEVIPGLSEAQVDADDQGAYRSARSAQAHEWPPRLTSFAFTAHQDTFHYTVENVADIDASFAGEVTHACCPVTVGVMPTAVGHRWL